MGLGHTVSLIPAITFAASCVRTSGAWEIGRQSRGHSQVTIGGHCICSQTAGAVLCVLTQLLACGFQPSCLILTAWYFCPSPPAPVPIMDVVTVHIHIFF